MKLDKRIALQNGSHYQQKNMAWLKRRAVHVSRGKGSEKDADFKLIGENLGQRNNSAHEKENRRNTESEPHAPLGDSMHSVLVRNLQENALGPDCKSQVCHSS